MDVSFSHFLQEMSSNPVLLITVILTLGVIFVNGWTDAPNAIATCITTRCLGARTAILLSAVFNFLGVFIMTQINSSVASTISNMVDFGSQHPAGADRLVRGFVLHCGIQRGRLPILASPPVRATA